MSRDFASRTDAERIVRAFATAIAATSLYGPEALRIAAERIKQPSFSDGEDTRWLIPAFVDLLERRADAKQAALRAAYGRPRAKT